MLIVLYNTIGMKEFILTLLATAMVLLATPAIMAQAESGVYEWEMNLEAGLEQAAAEEKLLFLYVAGTDWCPWCMRFDGEILAARVFKRYLADNFVPVLIDFPRQRAQSEEQQQYNRAIFDRFQVEGFPTVIILVADGTEMFRTGFREGGPHSYIRHLRRAVR